MKDQWLKHLKKKPSSAWRRGDRQKSGSGWWFGEGVQEITRYNLQHEDSASADKWPTCRQEYKRKLSIHLNGGISRHRKVQRLKVFRQKGETEKSYVFFYYLLLFCSVNDTPGYNLIKYLVLCSSPLTWMLLNGHSAELPLFWAGGWTRNISRSLPARVTLHSHHFLRSDVTDTIADSPRDQLLP